MSTYCVNYFQDAMDILQVYDTFVYLCGRVVRGESVTLRVYVISNDLNLHYRAGRPAAQDREKKCYPA